MTIDEQISFLTRGCVDVVSKADLAKKLESGKTLKIKLGCDPTSADLHLGHSVALSLMRRFQDMGHTAVLVIGDFTATVGTLNTDTILLPNCKWGGAKDANNIVELVILKADNG